MICWTCESCGRRWSSPTGDACSRCTYLLRPVVEDPTPEEIAAARRARHEAARHTTTRGKAMRMWQEIERQQMGEGS